MKITATGPLDAFEVTFRNYDLTVPDDSYSTTPSEFKEYLKSIMLLRTDITLLPVTSSCISAIGMFENLHHMGYEVNGDREFMNGYYRWLDSKKDDSPERTITGELIVY